MAHHSMLRPTLRWLSASLLLIVTAQPAMAGYKLWLKEPVCSAQAPCATDEFNGNAALSVSMPAYDDPNTGPGVDMPALTFNGNVFLSQVVSNLCEQGTSGQPEWLQAGSNVKGVTATLTAPGNYTMVLTFNATDNPNSICNASSLGQETKLYARGYTITQGTRVVRTVVSNGRYYVYNVAAIPEPETLLLLAVGMGAMLAVWRKRR